MLKGLLVSAALVGLGLTAASAQAEMLQTGRSTYLHHHYHAAHHYHMTYGRHHHNGIAYGVGSRDPRTTATGGNPGGYSTRN